MVVTRRSQQQRQQQRDEAIAAFGQEFGEDDAEEVQVPDDLVDDDLPPPLRLSKK